MKYEVVITKVITLDSRVVKAKSKKDAMNKAYGMFNKFDLDDYDEMKAYKIESWDVGYDEEEE